MALACSLIPRDTLPVILPKFTIAAAVLKTITSAPAYFRPSKNVFLLAGVTARVADVKASRLSKAGGDRLFLLT